MVVAIVIVVALVIVAAAGLRVTDVSYDLHAEQRPDNIETEYEQKFSRFGEKINRCEIWFP